LWDWSVAEREFRRALELNPNAANAHKLYSLYLTTMGRQEEALAEIKRAVALDPLNRRSRSFSSARLMIRSSSAGTSGFSRTGGTGARFRMLSKITPELSPRKGNVPVAISYKTAPKENRSLRASSSFARICSGDM
jgi:tetratricopeptide (TPR) repeat protein